MPPWMSFVERPDVPDAKSLRSTRATFSPRVAASHATPAPTQPPPMTTTSKVSSFSRRTCSARDGAAQGMTYVPSSQRMGDGTYACWEEICTLAALAAVSIGALAGLPGGLDVNQRLPPLALALLQLAVPAPVGPSPPRAKPAAAAAVAASGTETRAPGADRRAAASRRANMPTEP